MWAVLGGRGFLQIAQEEDGAVFLDIDTLKLERQVRAGPGEVGGRRP